MRKKLCGLVSMLLVSGSLMGVAGENMFSGDKFAAKDWKVWIENSVKTAGTAVTFSAEGEAEGSVVMPEGKKGAHLVQLFYNIALEKDKKYKLSFELDADEEGNLNVGYILAKDPWTNFWNVNIKISPDKTAYECVVAPKEVKGEFGEPRSLRFFLGGMKGKFKISNVNLTAAE